MKNFIFLVVTILTLTLCSNSFCETLNGTYYFLIPASSTTQDRANFDQNLRVLTGYEDSEGNLLYSDATYSVYSEHPSDGTYVYGADNLYHQATDGMTAQEKYDSKYLPSSEMSGANDVLYTKAQVEAMGFFPVEG